HGKVKMIYIDPPYNTGGDFVYPDNFKEGLDTYLKYSGQADDEGVKYSTNTESGGRYHSNWLNMMDPRLFMAKSLLAEDGVIFVSIDDHEVANLRTVLDEIFGSDNFVDTICWKKKYGGGAKEKHLVSMHEYILIYARNKLLLPEIMVPLDDESISKYYKNKDENYATRGAFRTHPLEAVQSFDIRENLAFAVTAPDGTPVYPKRQWRWGKATFDEAIKNNEVIFNKNKNGEWVLYSKQYLKNPDGSQRKTKAQSVIADIYTLHGTNEIIELFNNAKIFDFPKPTQLVKNFLNIGSSEEDSIILDFFAGSGTTADAVMQLNKEDGGNRKYILVQLPEPTDEKSEAHKAGFPTIAHITRERVRRVIAKLKDENNGKLIDPTQGQDLGFKAFKLTASNFKLWNPDTAPTDATELAKQLELYVDNIQPGKTDEAILYEIILKAGFPLTAKIEAQIIGQQTVYVVENGALLVCLADPIEEATLRGMLALKPVKMVALDVAFHGNDQLKTNIRLQSEQTGEGDQSRTQFVTV
ncbi:MAG: site-specific DNA-methyltransferase, partial [Vampirovibrionales bacterium]|nr:site-specific DNA-methyltransferase [Vampirovibrionales bacterium]